LENVIEITGLNKRYDGFSLSDVNLSLPKGCIMGFIGENGAGKSTTIKLILNLIRRDSGMIKVFGKDNLQNEKEIKEQVGIVFDESNFPETMRAPDVNSIMKRFYRNWEENTFRRYCDRFSLPSQKTIKDFSRGMKMKLSIAAAMSHRSRLLVLDEATSGLDPIMRDEILEIFLEFIQDEENSIFVSSHILSDIEKAADYITLIHKGRIVFTESKDELINNYGILKCGRDEFEGIDKSAVKGYRKNEFGVEALVLRDQLRGRHTLDHANIEDIMLLTIRGDAR
jgi:ABC-2 type transport system ATP-binding protein